MAKKAPPRFDLMDAAEWISDRTEIDVEIALEILEADYAFLRGSGLTGKGQGTGHLVVALGDQVTAVTQKVTAGEEVVRAVLDAFMEYLNSRGYVKEMPELPEPPEGS